MLAANVAQPLNMSNYANALGVSVKTIKRWISVLEASYIIFLLPPFYKNLGKRIIKAPKIYFYDNGLVTYLVGIESKKHYEHGPMAGQLFENYMVSELYKNEIHNKTHAELFYFRTSNGLEVDLIIDRKSHKQLIEIKHSETYHPRMSQPLESIWQSGDEAFLLYQGETLNASGTVKVMNYKEFFNKKSSQ